MNERPEQLTMEGTTLQQTDVLVVYYQKELKTETMRHNVQKCMTIK